MSAVDSARFGAWFDRLQAMVLHALDRLSRSDVLTFVPEDLALLLGVDVALVVVRVDWPERVRVGWFGTGAAPTDAPPEVGATAIDLADRLDRPRVLDDPTVAARFGGSRSPVRSAAAAPLRGRDRFGVVVVGSAHPGAFDDGILALLQVAADQYARVFESARLLDTERIARERAEFLAGLNEVLTRSLDVEEILEFVTRTAVPRLADWCTLLVPATRPGEDDRRAFWHSDPDRVDLARELALRYPFRPGVGPSAVIRTGEPRVFPRLTAEDLDAASPELAAIARTLDLGSVVILPLRAPIGVIGSLSLMREGARDPFTEADVELAQDVADRLAVGLHNALQYEDQVAIAWQLQQSLLPRELPQIPGVDLAGAYWAASRNADVGGDLYDVFALADDRWGVLIGDVSGKGIDAAVLTALVRHTARAAARHTARSAEVLRWVNDAFADHGFETSEMFCTAVFGILERDGADVRFRFSIAGHPTPVAVAADGSARRVGAPGQAIGIFADIEVHEREVVIHPGEVLVLYTDGVTDVPGDTALDEAAWTEVVAQVVGRPEAVSAAAIARLTEEWLARHHAPARERDDVALLVLRAGEAEDGAAPDDAPGQSSAG